MEQVIKEIILLFIGVFIGFFLGFQTHKYHHDGELWNNYESGAWAVVMHHRTYGNYGSQEYRRVAYEWGDPQTEEEVKMLINMVNERIRKDLF